MKLPEVNSRVHGWTVDFLWREQGLVVEVDGCGNHRSPAQVRRDRKMDRMLRQKGLTVLRYSDEQVADEAAALISEIRSIPPARSA
jgi:very-short-patch-repair endonuclease